MGSQQETINRLNLQMKKILGKYEDTVATNLHYEQENGKLADEVKEMKLVLATTSHANVRLKKELELVSAEKSSLSLANQKLKKQVNVLTQKQHELEQRNKIIENSLRSVTLSAGGKQAPNYGPPISSPPGNSSANKELEEKYMKLQQDYDEISRDLHDAYDTIDELEFELESIDFLESEVQNLQERLTLLNTQSDEEKQGLQNSAAHAESYHSDQNETNHYEQQEDHHDGANYDDDDDDDDDRNAVRHRRTLLQQKLQSIHQRQSIHFSKTAADS